MFAGVSGGFPGVLPFRPTYRLAGLDMGEIILKGTLKLNQRTIGPVNAHLISWPSKAQSIQNLENIW